MFAIAIAMLVSIIVAGLVVLYVAFPHRGAQVPGVPWLGDALRRASGAVPVLDEDEAELLRRK